MGNKISNENSCHFCGNTDRSMLYNKGGRKVCSVCIKIILETITDYAQQN